MSKRNRENAEGFILLKSDEPLPIEQQQPLNIENAEALTLFDDPLAYLRQMEQQPLSVLIEYQKTEPADSSGWTEWEIGGVDQWHTVRLPDSWDSLPARVTDALDALGALQTLASEITDESKPPRIGWLLLHAVELGKRLAAMQVRPFERAAKTGVEAITRPARVMSPVAHTVTATEQTENAKAAFRAYLRNNPDGSDKSARAYAAKQLNLSVATISRYITKPEAKRIRNSL